MGDEVPSPASVWERGKKRFEGPLYDVDSIPGRDSRGGRAWPSSTSTPCVEDRRAGPAGLCLALLLSIRAFGGRGDDGPGEDMSLVCLAGGQAWVRARGQAGCSVPEGAGVLLRRSQGDRVVWLLRPF